MIPCLVSLLFMIATLNCFLRLAHTAMALTVYCAIVATTVRLLQILLSLALLVLILMNLGQSPARPVMQDIHV